MNPDQIRRLRDGLQLSRPEMARLCGADVRTVMRWEDGETRPTGASLVVLQALHAAWADSSVRDCYRLVKRVSEAARKGGLVDLIDRGLK